MPRTKRIKIFKFEELTGTAKDAAWANINQILGNHNFGMGNEWIGKSREEKLLYIKSKNFEFTKYGSLA